GKESPVEHKESADVKHIHFPTGLAVFRITSNLDPRGGRQIHVASMTPDRAVYWNEVGLDQLAIREVVVNGITPGWQSPFNREQLLKKAMSNACGLCFIFARVENPDCASGAVYAGGLWECEHGRLLGNFHALVEQVEYTDGKKHDIAAMM